jgi:hypothetical protein
LVFTGEGNPDFLDSEETVINFAKKSLISRLIKGVLSFQQNQYPFKATQPLYSLLMDYPVAEKKDLQELTFIREPKDAQLNEIDGWDKRIPQKKFHRRSFSLPSYFSNPEKEKK